MKHIEDYQNKTGKFIYCVHAMCAKHGERARIDEIIAHGNTEEVLALFDTARGNLPRNACLRIATLLCASDNEADVNKLKNTYNRLLSVGSAPYNERTFENYVRAFLRGIVLLCDKEKEVLTKIAATPRIDAKKAFGWWIIALNYEGYTGKLYDIENVEEFQYDAFWRAASDFITRHNVTGWISEKLGVSHNAVKTTLEKRGSTTGEVAIGILHCIMGKVASELHIAEAVRGLERNDALGA